MRMSGRERGVIPYLVNTTSITTGGVLHACMHVVVYRGEEVLAPVLTHSDTNTSLRDAARSHGRCSLLSGRHNAILRIPCSADYANILPCRALCCKDQSWTDGRTLTSDKQIILLSQVLIMQIKLCVTIMQICCALKIELHRIARWTVLMWMSCDCVSNMSFIQGGVHCMQEMTLNKSHLISTQLAPKNLFVASNNSYLLMYLIASFLTN